MSSSGEERCVILDIDDMLCVLCVRVCVCVCVCVCLHVCVRASVCACVCVLLVMPFLLAVSTGPSAMSKEEVYKYRLMEKFAGVWKSRVKKGTPAIIIL